MSKRRAKEEWLELVEDWEASGMSGAAWCRERGVHYQCFLYWRRRSRDLAGTSQAVIPAEGGFCEILPSGRLTLEVDGVLLHLERGFDGGLLREVVSTLKGV